MENKRIYDAGRTAPPSAIKAITGGAYGAAKLSDINPQWRIEKMTDIFGAIGSGWWWEPVEITERENVLYAHVIVKYVNDNGEWSAPIHGYGGTKFGGRDDSDIYKSTITDALGNALRYLGIGADVWYKDGNTTNQFDTKYSAPPADKPADKTAGLDMTVSCARCGRPVTDQKAFGKAYSAAYIVGNSKRQYGAVYCLDCCTALEKARKQRNADG